jgi:hypothetical protein
MVRLQQVPPLLMEVEEQFKQAALAVAARITTV